MADENFPFSWESCLIRTSLRLPKSSATPSSLPIRGRIRRRGNTGQVLPQACPGIRRTIRRKFDSAEIDMCIRVDLHDNAALCYCGTIETAKSRRREEWWKKMTETMILATRTGREK